METRPIGNRKGLLQNDRLLVCGMLVFYGLCFVGLGGTAFWWLNQRSQMLLANATSTAAAIVTEAHISATEQARGTATAIARATEQGQYTVIDHFDSNRFRWMVDSINTEYWEGSTTIKDGVYVWNINEVKKSFVQWADFYHGFPMGDFDTYLDMKFVEGTPGNTCGGLVFRKSTKGWDDGAYIFTICNDSSFKVEYHGENGWEFLSNWQDNNVIHQSDWNRIEISARGDHFLFTINNKEVYKLTDERLEEGGLAIIIDVDESPAEVWFDNFGYQSR